MVGKDLHPDLYKVLLDKRTELDKLFQEASSKWGRYNPYEKPIEELSEQLYFLEFKQLDTWENIHKALDMYMKNIDSVGKAVGYSSYMVIKYLEKFYNAPQQTSL